uniref:Uncharacterized protein n=1 Tax=Apteryx owenii TaxID=8824 RepID=A0A8B9SET2_APTOW
MLPLLLLLATAPGAPGLTSIDYVPTLTNRTLGGRTTASTFVLEQPRCVFGDAQRGAQIWLVVALAAGRWHTGGGGGARGGAPPPAGPPRGGGGGGGGGGGAPGPTPRRGRASRGDPSSPAVPQPRTASTPARRRGPRSWLSRPSPTTRPTPRSAPPSPTTRAPLAPGTSRCCASAAKPPAATTPSGPAATAPSRAPGPTGEPGAGPPGGGGAAPLRGAACRCSHRPCRANAACTEPPRPGVPCSCRGPPAARPSLSSPPG